MADQRNAIAAFDVEVDAVEHRFRAVGLARALQLEHHAAALHRGGELEVNALALGRHFEPLDLLEHLDAALHLRGLGRLVAEAIDELLDALDLFVLAPLGVAQPLQARVAFLQVFRVVGVVLGDRPQCQVRDVRHHGVEKVAIVGDQDHRVRVGDKILFEPVAGLEVEVVCRLVQQEQIRRAQQQLRQRETHLPATRQVIGQLLLHLRLEAEPAQHGRDLELDLIAVAQAETILHLAIPREDRLVIRFG